MREVAGRFNSLALSPRPPFFFSVEVKSGGAICGLAWGRDSDMIRGLPRMIPLADIVFDPLFPMGLVVAVGLVLVVLTVAVYFRVGAGLSPWKKAVLTGLRVLGVAGIVLLLLQPSRVETLRPEGESRVTLVAVDDSASMTQRDVAEGSRVDAVRAALAEAGLLRGDGAPGGDEVRIFKFSERALPLANVSALDGSGATTRFHTSMGDVLGSVRGNESARALVLLSDGHDFEGVNAAKTGFLARGREVPIFAVPMGRAGKVRDVAARVAGYLPYVYVKQKARVGAVLRLIGCELESLEVELVREGAVVQRRRVEAGEEPELRVDFEVAEPVVGQFEYEIRVRPLSGEVDAENNSALTYLNVIDQQIQVLFLEGSPYWDSTFLQRSLMRNEKMNVDAVISYGEGKVRVIQKRKGAEAFKLPKLPQEWRKYDVVVLGRDVDAIVGSDGLAQITDYAKNQGGAVVFSRGAAFGKKREPNELEPVIWGSGPAEHVRMVGAREGLALAPFRALADEEKKGEGLPELIAVHPIAEKKTLAATLATARAGAAGEAVPAMIHRRLGSGQVLSVGVDGLWRWAFNAEVDGANTFFDRFWDQMVLWLMAGRDFAPTEKFSLRANSANIPVGEKIFFHALSREGAGVPREVPLVISQNGAEVGRTTLMQGDQAPERLSAEFLPAKPGRYEATAQVPGAKAGVRFIVYEENPERTEVALDTTYLKRLAEASGGRVVEPGELGKVLSELKSKEATAQPTTRLRSVWDRAWIFWTLGGLLACDWFLRRRWGLS